MVDTPDLKSVDHYDREGSSPSRPIKNKTMWSDYSDYLYHTLNLDVVDVGHALGKNNAVLGSATYSGDHIIKSRATVIEDGDTHIYNNIVYPKTGQNLPCLGMDLMCFFEKKVIIVFDFQHPTPHFDWYNPFMTCYLGEMLDNTSKDIRFFESGNHFSRYIYVRKCTASDIGNHLTYFKKYVDVYKRLLDTTKPTGEDTSVYKEFDKYMLDLDPVGGFMESKFGKEFSHDYVRNFLFSYCDS